MVENVNYFQFDFHHNCWIDWLNGKYPNSPKKQLFCLKTWHMKYYRRNWKGWRNMSFEGQLESNLYPIISTPWTASGGSNSAFKWMSLLGGQRTCTMSFFWWAFPLVLDWSDHQNHLYCQCGRPGVTKLWYYSQPNNREGISLTLIYFQLHLVRHASKVNHDNGIVFFKI